MVYLLDASGRIASVRTGNKCASGTGEFFRSLEKVEALAPRLVLPAHGKIIRDLPAVAAFYRSTFQQRQLDTQRMVDQGAKTVYRVARALFPDIPRNMRFVLEMYLAVSEAFTHVQILESEGRVTTQIRRKRLVVRPGPRAATKES